MTWMRLPSAAPIWLLASQAALFIAGALFVAMVWSVGLTLLAAVAAAVAVSTFWLPAEGDRRLQIAAGYLAVLAVVTFASAVTYDLVDPVLLLLQLVVLATAVAPAAYCAWQARSSAAWATPALAFLWALPAPLWAWMQHDASEDAGQIACGRYEIGSLAFGDAYGTWLDSWTHVAPAVTLLIIGAMIAWKQRSLSLAMAACLAALAFLGLGTYGIIKPCD